MARRSRLLAGVLVCLLATVLPIRPVSAGWGKAPSCGPVNDGEVWTDPTDGSKWECIGALGAWKLIPGTLPSGRGLSYYTYKPPWVYGSGQLLTGAGGGDAFANVWSEYPPRTPYYRPRGYIADRIMAWRWTGQQWSACRDSGYYYNAATAWGLLLSWDFGGRPPCGDGYYGVQGYGYTFHGGRWLGGVVWSDYIGLASILAPDGRRLAALRPSPASPPTLAPPPAGARRAGGAPVSNAAIDRPLVAGLSRHAVTGSSRRP